jgi:hypothetical protein
VSRRELIHTIDCTESPLSTKKVLCPPFKSSVESSATFSSIGGSLFPYGCPSLFGIELFCFHMAVRLIFPWSLQSQQHQAPNVYWKRTLLTMPFAGRDRRKDPEIDCDYEASADYNIILFVPWTNPRKSKIRTACENIGGKAITANWSLECLANANTATNRDSKKSSMFGAGFTCIGNTDRFDSGTGETWQNAGVIATIFWKRVRSLSYCWGAIIFFELLSVCGSSRSLG